MQISTISFKATLKNTQTTNKFMSQFPQKQQEEFVNILAQFGSEKDTVEISNYSKIVNINTKCKDEYCVTTDYPITEKANLSIDLKINDEKAKINVPIHSINPLKCLAKGILETNLLGDKAIYYRKHGLKIDKLFEDKIKWLKLSK